MKDIGPQFLFDQDPSLVNSDSVVTAMDEARARGERVPSKGAEQLATWLVWLEAQPADRQGILSDDLEVLRAITEDHIIDGELVPESYFEAQIRIAAEQGRGELIIGEREKAQMIDVVQSTQRSSLTRWTSYLHENEANYPDWFRLYVWDNVTRLGQFDLEKGKFKKRNHTTVGPFPEVDPEALAYVFDSIAAAYEDHDIRLARSAGNSSFASLYGRSLVELKENKKEFDAERIDGSWTEFSAYDGTHENAAAELSESLNGYGTGWCTAGLEVAEEQLRDGNFHVFYTADDEGRHKVPRIAVRMDGGLVTEVRGIGQNQAMEPVMEDVVGEKLKDLPGGDEYYQKVDDMKRVTRIARALESDPQAYLDRDDLRFLYELDRDVYGFGMVEDFVDEPDPRMVEIRRNRDVLQDISDAIGEDLVDGDITETLSKMISKGEYEAILRVLHVVQDVDGSVLDSLLSDEKFHAILQEDQYTHYSTTWHAVFSDLVMRNIESFNNISEGVVKLIIERDPKKAAQLMASEDHLTPEALTLVSEVLLLRRPTWEAAEMLHRFPGASPDAIIRLLTAGEKDTVYENYEIFSPDTQKAIRDWSAKDLDGHFDYMDLDEDEESGDDWDDFDLDDFSDMYDDPDDEW